ncbi:MAG: TIGR01459 family HAD-type hydrolase [Alphaproteobacteria bacterium]|nr:TIGR01459 family HAD-type hydrolase [Alphaproteobacteria bacterium]
MADIDSKLPDTELLPRLAPLADRYDHLIVDLWGTLHNGIMPLPGAIDCLAQFKDAGLGVALLSNAPFRVSGVRAVLEQISIPDTIYDDIFCSGEVAWHAIKKREDAWHQKLGRHAAFIGPDRHRPMLDNPGIDQAAEISEADFVICTGPRQPGDTLNDYMPELEEAAARGLPMICTNPDREVLRGDIREICAGAMAEVYENELGGDVAWHGKPYRPVYDEVLSSIGAPDRARVLMIGDGLLTDIAGAKAAGLDAAFVVSGIAGEKLGVSYGDLPTPEMLAKILKDAPAAPRYAIPGLIW